MKAHPEIIAELRHRGITITALARVLGGSSQKVSAMLHGRRRYGAAERAIAQILGRDVVELFGPPAKVGALPNSKSDEEIRAMLGKVTP